MATQTTITVTERNKTTASPITLRIYSDHKLLVETTIYDRQYSHLIGISLLSYIRTTITHEWDYMVREFILPNRWQKHLRDVTLYANTAISVLELHLFPSKRTANDNDKWFIKSW